MSDGTVGAVLEVARRNIGFVEGPNNRNPYAPLVGHPNNQPWCASFVAAVFHRAQVPLPSTSPYTPTMLAGFVGQRRANITPKVGDVFFLYFASLGRVAHTGIVEALLPDGRLQTIEGNTDEAGGRTGGRVMRKHRARTGMTFGHPDYAVPVVAKKPAAEASPVLRRGSSGVKVTDIQNALFKRRYLPEPKKSSVDSQYGEVTEKAVKLLQLEHGLPQTGVVAAAEWVILRRIAHGR